MSRFILSFILMLAACATDDKRHHRSSWETGEIRYVSADLSRMGVFYKGGARLGSPPGVSAIWPPAPTREIDLDESIRCLSVGTPGNSVEFAIKRPIRIGQQYQCLETSFRVSKCFDYCKAAIIEVVRLASGNLAGTYKDSMYVDSCRGVIILGTLSDLSEGVPLNAEWLQGEVGILSDPTYPNCRRF
jgi:hypothetical protein